MIPALWAGKALSFLKAVPWQAWAVIALCALLLGLRWHWIGVGYDRCQSQTAEAERKADVKADIVTKKAAESATVARQDIRKDAEDASDEARIIVRTLPASCPAQPKRLRDLGEQAVEGARGEMLGAEGR